MVNAIRERGFQMSKLISTQSVTAAVLAALVGTLAAVLTPAVPEAAPQARDAGQRSHLDKGDRLPMLVRGRACSSNAWPNYDRSCQFDLRRSADDVRAVRIVNLQRPAVPVIAATR
jgi:hypothetical protein